MSITDELREWLDEYGCEYGSEKFIAGSFGSIGQDRLISIADRIDAEHETAELQKESYRLDLKAANIAVGEAYKRGFDEGFASAYDWLGQHEDAMAEHGWIRLPKDADGEYIRVGDVMESKGSGLLFDKASFEVRIMRCDECGWEVYDRLGDRYEPSLLRHHHAPTVEDVLTEFGIDWEHESDCEDRAALLKEYAKRLKLAEVEDE